MPRDHPAIRIPPSPLQHSALDKQIRADLLATTDLPLQQRSQLIKSAQRLCFLIFKFSFLSLFLSIQQFANELSRSSKERVSSFFKPNLIVLKREGFAYFRVLL